MTRSSRGLFLFFGLAITVTVGCGGGGGATGGPPPVGPTGAPFATIGTRPLASGDAFAYAGTTQQSFVFMGAVPSPASNTTYTVTQNVAVTGPVSFNGQTSAFDFKTSETDASPLQSIATTTDSYYGTSGSNYVTYGYASRDTLGEALNVAYGAARIVDRLPEVRGDMWTNTAAQTLTETSPGGVTSQRTYAADGSYTDTTNYPVGSIYSANVPALTATITQNADGSGSYVLAGGGQNVIALSIGTPRPAAAGGSVIPIVRTRGAAAPTETDVSDWYPAPLVLYGESDANTGGSTIPAACNVAASIATTANVIVQNTTSIDTINGTVEKIHTTNYVIPTTGVVCVTLADTLQSYYDYSGQSPTFPKLSSTPQETKTVSTALGLTSSTVQPALRRAASAPASAAAFRVADARANLLALVEHEKIAYRRRFAAALARTLMENAR